MDQRIGIGADAAPAQPIHRACVVTGCWCGSRTAGLQTATAASNVPARQPIGVVDGASTNLTHIALRSVGLPVV